MVGHVNRKGIGMMLRKPIYFGEMEIISACKTELPCQMRESMTTIV